MTTDLSKWNPFKFLRKAQTGNNGDRPSPDAPATKNWLTEWPEVSRLFSSDPWRVMGEVLHDPFAGGALDRWFGDFSSSRFRPRIDVVDDGDVLRITAELPGMDRSDLQTSIEEGVLVLRGEKKQDTRSEENGCYRLERSYGAFTRTVPLPDGVDVDKVEAKFDKGVLTIRLPKTASARSPVRKVEIK
ncbi:Hsp20/alpha crystallin family protein [Paraburkholderia xenovorans]|uniref:Hsp20/alpha crystallin family protein n=1 Tax=Paraburkholderia xenovorans TaxID=36873 RepID=UPI001558D50C|nr:Hsp20/alpha crystallin family protein [Paraburkholderia xenovorans]NPT39583.1 Hsp20 family protein [Paraburkholderia xenovorans]